MQQRKTKKKWTQDIKDCFNMTAVEVGHLAKDRHCFEMAVIKAMFDNK
jgi:hypothetical protein